MRLNQLTPIIIFISLLLWNQVVFSKIIKKKIGEISKVDDITHISQVVIHDKETFRSLEEKVIWLVLDDDEEVAARFNITRKYLIEGKILLDGYFTEIKKKLYIGLSIAFEQIVRKETILPDEVVFQKALPDKIVNAKDQTTLILIPQGNFVYGSNIIGEVHYTSPAEKESDILQKIKGQKRVNYISLPAFYMDTYEITQKQFAQFLQETGVQPPPDWSWDYRPEYPINRVSYRQAEQYCHWSGKRLPSELEWEKAARGANLKVFRDHQEELRFLESPKLYSIGQEFNPNICITRESGLSTPLPVYSLQDDSSYHTSDGLHIKGLCGNVSEWTSSWFLPYRGNSIPHVMYGRRFKVIRGGAYDQDRKWAKAYSRKVGGIPDLSRDYKAGFRCAMNAK